jgi:hypothetical protein
MTHYRLPAEGCWTQISTLSACCQPPALQQNRFASPTPTRQKLCLSLLAPKHRPPQIRRPCLPRQSRLPGRVKLAGRGPHSARPLYEFPPTITVEMPDMPPPQEEGTVLCRRLLAMPREVMEVSVDHSSGRLPVRRWSPMFNTYGLGWSKQHSAGAGVASVTLSPLACMNGLYGSP